MWTHYLLRCLMGLTTQLNFWYSKSWMSLNEANIQTMPPTLVLLKYSAGTMFSSISDQSVLQSTHTLIRKSILKCLMKISWWCFNEKYFALTILFALTHLNCKEMLLSLQVTISGLANPPLIFYIFENSMSWNIRIGKLSKQATKPLPFWGLAKVFIGTSTGIGTNGIESIVINRTISGQIQYLSR